ncbi:MAG: hypothetical protein WC784_04585 [Candidatus Shapirobacteria bacterium]|jgi:hypothetical protein
MTNKNLDLQNFMDKVKNVEKGHKFDLASGEDLSMAVMNLIAIEEHMFFNGNKTGKTKYFELLNEAREMRKSLMKMLIPDYEGEVWCTSKHLLAASMRVMEVGTKYQTKGDTKTAYDLFKKSFDLYNLFWGINLGLVDNKGVGATLADAQKGESKKDTPLDYKKSDMLGKVSGIIGKILDCCRE